MDVKHQFKIVTSYREFSSAQPKFGFNSSPSILNHYCGAQEGKNNFILRHTHNSRFLETL